MVTTALDGPGAQYVDRIIGECLAARLPAPLMQTRLEAAAHLAETLERANR